MAQDQNDNRRHASVTDTLLNLEPFAAGFKIYSNRIEDAVSAYFDEKDLHFGRPLVVLASDNNKSGYVKPNQPRRVKVFFLLNPTDPGVDSQMNKIPEQFREKFRNVGSEVTIEKWLSDILLPFARTKEIKDKHGNTIGRKLITGTKTVAGHTYAYVILDIFRILSVILCAKYGEYRLEISDTANDPNRQGCIMNVLKAKVYNNKGKNKGDDNIYDSFSKTPDR